MKQFTASCFQTLTGRYLSLDENKKSERTISALTIDDAYEQLSETQIEDSELPITQRWLVTEAN